MYIHFEKKYDYYYSKMDLKKILRKFVDTIETINFSTVEINKERMFWVVFDWERIPSLVITGTTIITISKTLELLYSVYVKEKNMEEHKIIKLIKCECLDYWAPYFNLCFNIKKHYPRLTKEEIIQKITDVFRQLEKDLK